MTKNKLLTVYREQVINIIVFINIYLILLFFSGYYFFEYTALLGRIIVFFIILILILLGRNTISKSVLQVFALLFLNVVITQCLTGLNWRSLLMMGITLFEASIFVNVISFKEFRKQFINCMSLIAVVALIGNLVLIFAPSLLSVFPQIVNSHGRSSTFLLFAMISDFRASGAYRNQGIFWEPGAYQVFLCIAYIFELYNKSKHKLHKWILLLYWVSMITTMSTTGFIVAMALLVLTLGKLNSNLSIVKIGIVSILLFFMIMNILPYLNGYWEYMLTEKINQVLNYRMGVGNESSSRIDSVAYVVPAFFRSPIWGIGTQGFINLGEQVGHTMFTCTPVNWIATYGIFWGVFVYRSLWKMLRRFIKTRFEVLVALIIICISVFSEEVSTNIFFVILMFYGITQNRQFYYRSYTEA